MSEKMSETQQDYVASVTSHLSSEDKKKLQGYIKEISNSMVRADAERDFIKDVIDRAKNDFSLAPKDVRKIANIYHKQSFIEEKAAQEMILGLYEDLFG